MNRDKILKMEAGRELDALVAEKVMELSYILFDGTDHSADELIPSYSTDIAAAWEVVEKLQSEPLEYYVEIAMTPAIPHKGKPCWHVEIGGNKGYADTAPLAICLAALLAVESINV